MHEETWPAISNEMHQSSRSDIQSILIEGIYAGCSLKSSCVVALSGTSHQFGPSWIRVLIYESMIYRVSWSMSVQCLALVRAVPASGKCLHAACMLKWLYNINIAAFVNSEDNVHAVLSVCRVSCSVGTQEQDIIYMHIYVPSWFWQSIVYGALSVGTYRGIVLCSEKLALLLSGWQLLERTLSCTSAQLKGRGWGAGLQTTIHCPQIYMYDSGQCNELF